MYRKKPKNPARTNHFISFLCGILIFINKVKINNEKEAIKYLKNPSDNGVKNCNANLVKTKAEDQKIMVLNAKG
jgi:hypothetical protein